MSSRKSKLVFVAILTLSGLVGLGATRRSAKPRLRQITITAEKYAYAPARLKVNVGDTLEITLRSTDVTHGFYLEGFQFNAYIRPETPFFYVQNPGAEEGEVEYQPMKTYTLVVDKTGKYRYRCSVTCGTMHPFMQGELIVGPNYPFTTAISLSIGLMLGALFYFGQVGRREESGSEALPKFPLPSDSKAETAPSSGDERVANETDPSSLAADGEASSETPEANDTRSLTAHTVPAVTKRKGDLP